MFEVTLTQVLSFVVPGATLAKSWVYGNKWKWAPLYGMIIQVGWIFYTFMLGWNALGMIILSIILFFVEMRNFFKWRSE